MLIDDLENKKEWGLKEPRKSKYIQKHPRIKFIVVKITSVHFQIVNKL